MTTPDPQTAAGAAERVQAAADEAATPFDVAERILAKCRKRQLASVADVETLARLVTELVLSEAADAREAELLDALARAERAEVDRVRMAAELEQVRGELAFYDMRTELATDLIIALASSERCQRDRFGNCAVHAETVPDGGDCPHALAKAFLSGARAHRRAETTATRPADGTAGTGDKRTPEQWCAEYDIDIRDPDGWRGKGDPAWDEPITLPDFFRRAVRSTCWRVTTDVWNRLSRDAYRAPEGTAGTGEGGER